MPWNRPRNRGFRVNTAAQPSGRPIASAIRRLDTINGNVTPARTATCCATGLPPITDTPRSPCSRPAIQSQYCAKSGLSKPSSARNDAIRSGVALVPAITAATSPGSTRSIMNTSADRPTKAAANSAKRFPTNRITVPNLTYSWKSAIMATPSGSACSGSPARACCRLPSRGSRTASQPAHPR